MACLNMSVYQNEQLTFPTITGHIVSPNAAKTTIHDVIGAKIEDIC